MDDSTPLSEGERRQGFIDRLYLVFILWHCEAFFTTAHRAQCEHLEARRAFDVSGHSNWFVQQRAFTDFESSLAFAANICKMLAPRALRKEERAPALARAKRLRQLLKIDGRSSVMRLLKQANTVRNHFEHIDTRLDKWAARTVGRYALMHALSEEIAFIEDNDKFNRFDPDKRELVMLGDKVEINDLWNAVIKVFEAATMANRDIESRLKLHPLR